MNYDKRALVTGGAGLIGSHVTDHLLREGWTVRILDNLEPQTHRFGKPAWVNEQAEFMQGDLTDRATIRAAMENIDVIFHQGAYGGYMPEIAKYVRVNSFGTAQMLEVIREDNLPIRKIVVASSQAVYSEGAAHCPAHGLVFPAVRPVEQLRRADWTVRCPLCGEKTTSAPTPEEAPVGGGDRLRPDQSGPGKTGLALGQAVRGARPWRCGIRVPSGRGNRFLIRTQELSPFSARGYSTACRPCSTRTASKRAIFRSWRTLPAPTGSPPSTMRSTGCRSTWAAARGVAVREVAEQISAALNIPVAPEVNGEFRPGEMRHLTSGTARIRDGVGYAPQTDLATGIGRYLEWIRSQGDVKDYFSEAADILRNKGIVHKSAAK